MGDGIQSRALLVVRIDKIPGRSFRISVFKHQITGFGVFVPFPERRDVHRTQFPLSDRVVYARAEAPFLFLLSHFQPNLDEVCTAIDNVLLDGRAEFEEALVLLRRAESHYVLDARAIIPTAIEDDDLATGGGKVDITLEG